MDMLKTGWNFFQNEVLGMAWLNRLIGNLINACGLDATSKIGDSPAWDLGTIWAPFTEKAPLTQAIKETPRTRKNIEFMRVSGVF